ncbi:hypothetical protein SKAU_G00028630 [Synaphobranchus kaupii]|uniref:DUF4585 domain-containing protein n=1 Tax=Synaphobranchus kaupii TaxID=118154 RepID=A0A9Q1GDB0_SYNKA|nr:hypothetical protein SKAU_G00028630 [Synaphobranchus kaupii]
MYLSREMETEADASMEFSDHCVPSTVEDESHYITTHEIQLSELDHDVDYDTGLGSRWDLKDGNLNVVYSFDDFASFDSDEAIEGKQVLEDRNSARVKSNQVQSNNTNRRATSRAAVSSKHENDLCDSDKCASSDEGLSNNQKGRGNSAGQIHLSIKTTSRAINEPSNIQEKENIRYHAKHEGDMSRYVFRDAKAEKICDSAKCFIAAPCRLHFGRKLKGKDVNEYSSGASSAVSELDDADKEVRNLTARAFRSLACPYFDAINFSTSSESSASEHGLGINRWSTFVDLKYGNMTQGRDKNLVTHKSATSTFEIAKNAEGKDSENYLTIPVKAHAMEAKPGISSSQERTAVYTFTATSGTPQTTRSASHPSRGDARRQEDHKPSPKRSSIVMETRSPDSPTATIYHHPLQMAMPGAQPHVICFSSSVAQQPPVDPFQQMQRKMLLDPTTGHYYLVDTPVQPATKRLFDPETGQYVDVPMPQQPMAPVPMPITPLALNPGAYGPTYMIYPGFLPTPTVLPTRTMQSQLSMHSEVDSGDKAPPHDGDAGGGDLHGEPLLHPHREVPAGNARVPAHHHQGAPGLLRQKACYQHHVTARSKDHCPSFL